MQHFNNAFIPKRHPKPWHRCSHAGTSTCKAHAWIPAQAHVVPKTPKIHVRRTCTWTTYCPASCASSHCPNVYWVTCYRERPSPQAHFTRWLGSLFAVGGTHCWWRVHYTHDTWYKSQLSRVVAAWCGDQHSRASSLHQNRRWEKKKKSIIISRCKGWRQY